MIKEQEGFLFFFFIFFLFLIDVGSYSIRNVTESPTVVPTSKGSFSPSIQVQQLKDITELGQSMLVF